MSLPRVYRSAFGGPTSVLLTSSPGGQPVVHGDRADCAGMRVPEE
jgi:hypothetical protein